MGRLPLPCRAKLNKWETKTRMRTLRAKNTTGSISFPKNSNQPISKFSLCSPLPLEFSGARIGNQHKDVFSRFLSRQNLLRSRGGPSVKSSRCGGLLESNTILQLRFLTHYFAHRSSALISRWRRRHTKVHPNIPRWSLGRKENNNKKKFGRGTGKDKQKTKTETNTILRFRHSPLQRNSSHEQWKELNC